MASKPEKGSEGEESAEEQLPRHADIFYRPPSDDWDEDDLVDDDAVLDSNRVEPRRFVRYESASGFDRVVADMIRPKVREGDDEAGIERVLDEELMAEVKIYTYEGTVRNLPYEELSSRRKPELPKRS
jgi:hypothetical protein